MQKSFLFLFVLFCTMVLSQKPLAKLLVELDSSIAKEKVFTYQKQVKIKTLLRQVAQTEDNYKLYLLYRDLSKQYEVFVADSAQLYTTKALNIAHILKNKAFVTESKIQLSRIKAKTGMFPLALNLLGGINKNRLQKNQLVDYYKAYVKFTFIGSNIRMGEK